ncbi:hypothetical protein [Musicola paradisiaca]|uniref:hypothetical protein n=1 Tax=Musicola paradisiaca TaxID=69223 RepID=UPI001885866B|nr:hypothetical protein [Musicola paradisiaca]
MKKPAFDPGWLFYHWVMNLARLRPITDIEVIDFELRPVRLIENGYIKYFFMIKCHFNDKETIVYLTAVRRQQIALNNEKCRAHYTIWNGITYETATASLYR